MGSELAEWVSMRIDEDGLDDEVGLVVLAAIDGEAEFDDYLAGGELTRSRLAETATTKPEIAEPAGAFLRSISVQGFRGIGPEVTVKLEPVPGLTVIAGRNGSGKSSIAEGLELILTGGTYRWKKKSGQWKEHWRNLHHPTPGGIKLEVIEEGVGKTTIATSWSDTATDVDDRKDYFQRQGGPQQSGLDGLGWTRPLETFRPLLSYDELGGLLEESPSALYDALAKVLGMEQLTDALKRIQAQLKEVKAPHTETATQRKALQQAAAALEDERAGRVAELLKKTAPNVVAVRAVATGVDQVDQGPVAALRALASLSAPDPDEVTAAAAALRRAVEGMAIAGEQDARRRLSRMSLRREALKLHVAHGDQSCPVCNEGTLDGVWAESSRTLVEREEEELAEITRVSHELGVARQRAGELVAGRPAPLDRSPVGELDDAVHAARQTWSAWSSAPESDLELADHLELHVHELVQVMEKLRAAASAALTQRDDAWGPLASRIASWCDAWDEWEKTKPLVDTLAAAEKWLKDNDVRLKNERVAPIADGARGAWAKLRQDSNVELGDLKLEGAATRRRVAITATVDGTEAGAIPVMSQGELHALALALFLPRASMAESPFRFIVIDDPIQAMDPAKVDGLVQLLAEIAQTRQVIVLSHDDRFPAAIRRSRIGARLLEVTRGEQSQVSIVTAQDPTGRYLADARALIRDAGLPEDTLRRTLPGLLRLAVESAARDRFFSHRVSKGEALHDVETIWANAKQTRDRVSLAIYDEKRPNLDSWLRMPYRNIGLGCVTTAMHNGLAGPPLNAVEDVKRMVEDIREGKK